MSTYPNIPEQLGFDVGALDALVIGRIASHAAGAPVRTELGTGATSRVIWAAQLDLLTASNRPPRPFLALRQGSLIPFERTATIAIYRWFVYDDPQHLYWRINKLLPLISRAYATAPRMQLQRNAISRSVVSATSAATVDPDLNLVMRYLTLDVHLT